MIDQHELVITPSIGIALFPEDGVDFDQLCQQADTAMYRAKRDGRNGYCFFTDDMQKRSRRRMLLENALHHALSRKQFHLNFQPQFTSDTGQLVGAEVLLRWTHPEYGMVSPAEFIPIAESNGLIIPIGAWVLRTALQQSKTWLNAGMAPMVMAVNVSAVQFRQPNFPEMVSQMLKEIEIPARYLELELTEGVAMGDPQSAIAIMDDLHKRGVRMSIDDFGTGYSSLNYLKKFKIYKLKIDQSFVRDICVDSDDSALVTTIIQMAHSMGMLAIAEGVETQAQWDFLRAHQCDEVQGYLFSKPLPAEKLVTFVQDQALGASEASL
jgi:EAL domain-containing protein (putative c-di-GMP-specific phosphodiesterase class I)